MESRLYRWALPILLLAGLGWGCASEGKSNVWGQQWNIPLENNTVGAKLVSGRDKGARPLRAVGYAPNASRGSRSRGRWLHRSG